MLQPDRRLSPARQLARAWFEGALAACSIPQTVAAALQVDHELLTVGTARFDLHGRRILIVAAGKAAEPMLNAAAAALAAFPLHCLCVAPQRTQLPPGTEWFAASHPLPNHASLAAAERTLALLSAAAPQDLVLFLVSGGASAMLELPALGISLAELRATYSTLVGSGASIAEINCLRKRISQIKGGRLAEAAAHTQQLTLLVSDVAPGEESALAAGPTLPDDSTVEEATRIVDAYRLRDRLPPTVLHQLGQPHPPVVVPRSHWVTLLDSRKLALEAARCVREQGWRPVVDETFAEGEVSVVADHLLARFTAAQAASQERVCLISCGEANVALPPAPGRGGRNQHLALLLAKRCSGLPVAGLCAGTDGIDGNSLAAGAVWDGTTVARAHATGLDAAHALATFNSEPFFAALGDSVVTGPTGNNLRDLRLIVSP